MTDRPIAQPVIDAMEAAVSPEEAEVLDDLLSVVGRATRLDKQARKRLAKTFQRQAFRIEEF